MTVILPACSRTGTTWKARGGRRARWRLPGIDSGTLPFAKPGEKPFVSLTCSVKAGQPHVTIVRHVPGRPGEKALFTVIGNRIISRFQVDAALVDNEWRWQGTLPADDPLLEVFEGPGALQATLPGGGTVKIAGSGVPGQFLTWCRTGGKAPAVETASPPDANSAA